MHTASCRSQANDADVEHDIRYVITSTNPQSNGLWVVDPTTGVITASTPVDFESLPDRSNS